MGSHPAIAHDRFPAQEPLIGVPVVVAFHNNLIALSAGEIIRADAEEPFVTIIELEDGRCVLGTECVYSPVANTEKPMTAEEVEPRRQALEKQINDAVAAVPGDQWPSAYRKAAEAIAEEMLGGAWLFNIHAAHGKRPQVFVGKYKGELALSDG